ncbi:sulfotransferase (plasmid) [Stanieria sp. NIES-3757]|nr:sulfotransferase [Stanieria sp. NIES-3757]
MLSHFLTSLIIIIDFKFILKIMLYALKTKIMEELQRHYLTLELPSSIEKPLIKLEKLLYERNLQQVPLKKPIFVIGSHRSGTTILYETLARHPDLAYFSNASAYFPRLPMLSHKFGTIWAQKQIKIERFLQDGIGFNAITPSEGTRIWDLYATNTEHYYLDETHHNPEMEHYLKQNIRKHLKYNNARRFINKNPDNSVRIRYLNQLFPDAYFIHIIRDGRAVCHSMIQAQKRAFEFFGIGHRHNYGIKTQNWSEIAEMWFKDRQQAIAHLWCETIATIDRDRQYLEPERYLEIRYEDFVSQTQTYLHRIAEFCQLPIDAQVEQIWQQETSKLTLAKRNEAWKQGFNPSELNKLMLIISKKMQEHGYELESNWEERNETVQNTQLV